jgi:hypothetical protein
MLGVFLQLERNETDREFIPPQALKMRDNFRVENDILNGVEKVSRLSRPARQYLSFYSISVNFVPLNHPLPICDTSSHKSQTESRS